MVERNGHCELKELNTKNSELWLTSEYYRETNSMPQESNFDRALRILYTEGLDSESEQIYNRIAMIENTLYYDLGRPDWRIMRIDSNGVEMVEMNENTPLFERRQNLQQQVEFEFSNPGAFDELLELLRIPEDQRQLHKIHLTSMFLEHIPVPIMVFSGEKGSAKTTTSRAVKQIVDPSSGGNAIAFPRSNDDLIQNLSHRYLVTFDNVSLIDGIKSDTLCTAITGIGQAWRKLYHDQEEIILSYRRKIIINGIGVTIERPDLLDRVIFYQLQPPQPDERITEEEFNEKFDALLPKVLGIIAQTLQMALLTRLQISKEITSRPRMADFAVYGEAISRAFGYQPNSFLQLLNRTMDQKDAETLENHPLVRVIEIIMEDSNHYEATVGEFFNEIRKIAAENGLNTTQSFFPSQPNRVRGTIQRISSHLTAIGYQIDISQQTQDNGRHPRNHFVISIDRSNEAISTTSTENSEN